MALSRGWEGWRWWHDGWRVQKKAQSFQHPYRPSRPKSFPPTRTTPPSKPPNPKMSNCSSPRAELLKGLLGVVAGAEAGAGAEVAGGRDTRDDGQEHAGAGDERLADGVRAEEASRAAGGDAEDRGRHFVVRLREESVVAGRPRGETKAGGCCVGDVWGDYFFLFAKATGVSFGIESDDVVGVW